MTSVARPKSTQHTMRIGPAKDSEAIVRVRCQHLYQTGDRGTSAASSKMLLVFNAILKNGKGRRTFEQVNWVEKHKCAVVVPHLPVEEAGGTSCSTGF